MDYPIHIDTISMELSILYLKGLPVKFLQNDVFLSLKNVFVVANRADPDEMLLGLHRLPKLLFPGVQNENG